MFKLSKTTAVLAVLAALALLTVTHAADNFNAE
jgi:hypothetical protein